VPDVVVSGCVCPEVVGVGCVDEGDTGVECGVDGSDRAVPLRATLDRHRHPAEADRADVERAQLSRLHVFSSIVR
jgi:hypothetical protein